MPQSMLIYKKLIVIILIAISFKIIPHPPNFSPQIILILCLGDICSKRQIFIGVLLLTILSDSMIAFVAGYTIFGTWSFYTYSAYILIAYMMYFIKCHTRRKLSSIKYNLIFMGITSSVFFWLWTNFGVWVFDGMYSKSWQGILECYILALPFLQNSLYAAIVYGGLFIYVNRGECVGDLFAIQVKY